MASPLDALISWSIRHRALVLIVAAALLVAGILMTARAPLDVLPDFTPPRVVVQTESPGMGTTDVEERVTWPLERVLLGTPETTSIRSISIAGLSVITMTFSDEADLFRTRQLVTERLQLASGSLPENAEAPKLEAIAPPVGALLRFCVTSDRGDARTTLRTFAEWKVRPRLAGIPGVAQVIVHGGLVERMEVRPDPRRMREHDVALADIERAAARSQAFVGAGAVSDGEIRVDVIGEAPRALPPLEHEGNVGDELAHPGAHVLAHGRGQVGAAIAIDVEGDRRVLRHAPDELEHVADDLRHGGFGLHGAEVARPEVGAQRLVAVLEHRLEKLLLVAEVVVHRGDVGVRAAADLLDRRVAETTLGKHLARHLEQALARIS
jgi:multidrug efflux pump subunit AcrB